jgi:hypothetical protein
MAAAEDPQDVRRLFEEEMHQKLAVKRAKDNEYYQRNRGKKAAGRQQS